MLQHSEASLQTTPWRQPLVDRPTAIYHQRMSHNHVSKRARQKQHSAHQVLGLVPPPPRNHLLSSPLLIARLFQNVLTRVSLGNTRCDHIHQNSLRSPLQRKPLRKLMHSSLHRRIEGTLLKGNHSKVRPDLNNPPAALRKHHPRRCLRSKEDTLQRSSDSL